MRLSQNLPLVTYRQLENANYPPWELASPHVVLLQSPGSGSRTRCSRVTEHMGAHVSSGLRAWILLLLLPVALDKLLPFI